jgi:glycosyltransferase involved in cell wall biosynthesis
MSSKCPLSVIVPTRNEARNLAACLEHLAWADEVVVFDSLSTDGTVDIARSRGARVVQRAFDDFATHKNWALDNVELRHDWILFVDADERITPALAAEIAAAIARPDAPNGFYVARQNWMWGKPMRSMYPDYQLRLVRRGKGRYEDRIVHEHMVIEGMAGYLKNHLVHRDEKGIERYFDRHNTYSSMEAVEAWRLLHGRQGAASIAAGLRARGPERHRALKRFAYRHLPFRPLFHFLYLYVAKRGFLDGRLGLRYCALRFFHEYQLSLKIEELNDPQSPLATKYRRELDR